MGSCISKCCHGPSAPIHPNQPNDIMPVISQSTAQPISNHSTTTSFSLYSSTSNYYSSSSSSGTKLYSSESMSSTTDRKKIVIPVPPMASGNPILGPKQRLQTAVLNTQLPTKREHSDSPPLCNRQKIFRREPKVRSAYPPTWQVSNYLPPTRRMKMVSSNPILGPEQRLQTAVLSTQLPTKREHSDSPPPCNPRKIFRWEPKVRSAYPPAWQVSSYLPPARRMKMVPPSNLVKDPLMSINYGEEKVRPPNSCITSRRIGKGHVKRRGPLVHPEQTKCGRMEDIENPLISMECFIFL